MEKIQQEYTRDEIIELTAGTAIEAYLNPGTHVFSTDKSAMLDLAGLDIAASIQMNGCELTALRIEALLKAKGQILSLEQIKLLLTSKYGCSFTQKTVLLGTSGGINTAIDLIKPSGDGQATLISSLPETQEMRVLAYVKEYGCPKDLADVRHYVNRMRFSNPLTDEQIRAILKPLGCQLGGALQPTDLLATTTLASEAVQVSTNSNVVTTTLADTESTQVTTGSGTATNTPISEHQMKQNLISYILNYKIYYDACPKTLADFERLPANRMGYSLEEQRIFIRDIDRVNLALRTAGCPTIETKKTNISIGEVSLPPLGASSTGSAGVSGMANTGISSSRPAPSYRSLASTSTTGTSGSGGVKNTTATVVDKASTSTGGISGQANQSSKKSSIPWLEIGLGALAITLLVGLYFYQKKNAKKAK